MSGSLSGPPGSSKRLRRAAASAAPLLTNVNVVIQFSCATVSGIEPAKLGPGIAAACCSTVKEVSTTVILAVRAGPVLGAT